MEPFASYLQGCRIESQYTLPNTPKLNDIDERRNGTPMDMVRSMMNICQVPESLWGEPLKTIIYILNGVLSNFVLKTPFESWTGRKPSLNYLRVWRCLADIKICNQQIKKLIQIE